MSGVTLDELLENVGITHMQLKKKCTNEHLHGIALSLKSWRTLAPHLGLSSDEVEVVDRDAHSEKERRQKCLESWKAKFAFAATYRVLVEALLKNGNADQAEEVCRLLVSQQPKDIPVLVSVTDNKPQSGLREHEGSEAGTTRATDAGLPSVLNIQPPFQQLSPSEQEELKGMLCDDVKEMKRLFGSLVSTTCDSVEKRIPVVQFAKHILALGAYEPAPEDRDRSLLDEHRQEIKGAKAIPEIFIILCAYWNYLNYEVLEYIIEHYGTSDDTKRLRDYNKKLHDFCKRRLFEVPMPVRGNGTENKSSPKQGELNIKLDVREDIPADQFNQIKRTIAKILHVRPATLQICRITKGCVELTFLIPKFVAQEIFPLSHEQTSALRKDVSVIRLECGDYTFEETDDVVVQEEPSVVDTTPMVIEETKSDVVMQAASLVEEGEFDLHTKPMDTEDPSDASGERGIKPMPSQSQRAKASEIADCITKYCCFLQSVNTGACGSSFIVELKGLQTANLLALNWKKRGKTGELQTDYALVTSHDTIPGLSLSDLEKNRWTVSCQGIQNGSEQILSKLVCGVISCCGLESLLAGHSSDATVTVFRPHPTNASCDIHLNITILFLNKLFAVLLQESIVFPPVIPVSEYLGKNTDTQLHQLIINTGRTSCISCCDGIQSVKTGSFSVVEQQRTSEHEQVLAREMIEFEKFQKLESNTTMEICHGSPVYLNPDTNEPLVIGVYVGKTSASQKGEELVVTFHGILRLLQGGLLPVLSVLQSLDIPKAWTGRWGYLVTPHIDQMKRMEYSYLCEILHFLLKERHGTPLLKLTVDIVDLDNEASLDLLCSLFKHFESADNADLNEAVTKLNLRNEMNAYITRLCKNVIHLLELGAIMVRDRTSLVEKCLTFYNMLLNLKFAGITEQILGTSENLKLLENIHQRYKHSDVVQQNATDISFNLSSVETTALENQQHYEAFQQALKEGIAVKLKYLKLLFFGPPRTGKTSMRRRLIGEILNLANEPVQASTGVAEHYDVIVKLFEDKTTTSTTVITKSEWSNVKALFGKDKSTHETDLDEELQLLYRFIYTAVPPTENKSPASPITEPSNESRSPVPNPVIEKEVESHKADPNACISTPQISSVREHGLSAKQMEEIEKAFESFDKVLRRGGREQLKVLLEGTILMNIVDTGGQPAFLEMLPALTMGPALYLIFFRLNQELKSTYQIQYVSENKENIQVLGESSYNVEEVIFQALSSIACFSYTEPKKNMPNVIHAAMLMGTHKDQLGSDPETVANEIKIKDAALQNNLRDVMKTNFLNSENLHYASDQQLMFAVDNMRGDEKELIKVRERLDDVIKQEFDDFSIPASWLMFSIFLRKMSMMGNHTLTLLQCHKIGERLKVRDIDEALWFLHHHVGTLMHFPEAEEIKDIVICDPQIVFDSVTDLILNSFTFQHVGKLACENFKIIGQFSFKDIQRIARNSKSDHLPLPKLVKLLEHLNIIAPIRPEYHSSCPQSDEVFFMPAVLKHATEEELHMEQSLTDPVPLMIHFKCGFVPVGVFCAMIASLIAQENTLGWILQNPRDGHSLCKNKVTFRVNGAYKITLISKPKQYEIHIAHISDTDRAMEIKICQHVLETICDTLDQVISKMKYKQNPIYSRSDQSIYELGFKCPCHLNDDHLVINRPRSGVKPQSTKSLWLNYLAIERESTMICLQEQICIDLRDTRLPKFRPFAQQSLVWFGEATEISSAIPDLLPAEDTYQDFLLAKELDVKNAINVLDEANFADGDWAQLGLQLIDHFDSTTISADHGRASDCMIHTIFQWLRTDTEASWEKLAKAVSKVKGYGEATADIVRQKTGLVHTEAISWEGRVSSQLPLTSTVGTHEYLCGFEVFAETSFVVPDSHSHSFEWQGHGLKLHIPEGAVPAHTGCKVDIKAGFTGQFNIPDDLQLISCVYWLSCSQKFNKPVTLEIEHCASLQDSSQSSALRFIAAKCSQAELPYQFKVLENGIFKPKSSYGSIQVSQFSFFAGIGILERFQSLKSYCSTVYYIQKNVNKWDVDFVIAPNLQASLTAIQERYWSLDATPGTGVEVQFEDEAISLAIPDDGVCLPNGWAITPLVSPIISKQQVTMFKPGQMIPSCQLRVKLDNCENPVELEYKVNLLGTKGPHKFFTITCSPQEYVVEKPGRATGGKRKQLEEKQHKVPKKRCLSDVPYVEKPVRAATRKRKQSGKEQGVPKKRHSSNVTSAAATHTSSLAATDDGIPFPSSESTTSSNQAVAATETIFSKPQIKDLMDALYQKVADKWKIIGVLLEISKGKLASIAEKYRDPQNCLLEMLEIWLERVDPPPTWAAIIEAVEFLGEEQLGKTLRDKYTVN